MTWDLFYHFTILPEVKARLSRMWSIGKGSSGQLKPFEPRELLKLEAEAKLNRSGIVSLAADHTERRGILHAECRVVEHDVVEGVQEVG
jgi:hypothetical protein